MSRRAISVGPVGRRLGQALYALRRQARMSQRDLAALLETAGTPIGATGILRIEKGIRRVDVDELLALSKVLEFPVADLLAGTACPVCFDSPPDGFTCNACGVGA